MGDAATMPFVIVFWACMGTLFKFHARLGELRPESSKLGTLNLELRPLPFGLEASSSVRRKTFRHGLRIRLFETDPQVLMLDLL